MNILEQIRNLEPEIQINNCGESIIPFLHKIADPTHYKCMAKICGKQSTISSVVIDCSYLKPRVYVPDYFEEWIKEFLTTEKIYMVLNLALCNVYKNHGHCNILIINKESNCVERFEPRGNAQNPYYDDLPIENAVKGFVKTYFEHFIYLSPYEFIGNKGPQANHTLQLNFDLGRGLCVNYSILYLYLRCKDGLTPEQSIKFMNDHFLGENILKFTAFVNLSL